VQLGETNRCCSIVENKRDPIPLAINSSHGMLVHTLVVCVQNRRMAEELRLHVQETDELQRQKKLLEEERRTLLREVDIKQDMEAEYAKKVCTPRPDTEGQPSFRRGH
jgi:hypothetical protein